MLMLACKHAHSDHKIMLLLITVVVYNGHNLSFEGLHVCICKATKMF